MKRISRVFFTVIGRFPRFIGDNLFLGLHGQERSSISEIDLVELDLSVYLIVLDC